MYDPIPQPRACLGWKPHPLHTWNLGTVDYPQLGSGPLLVAIPSQRSINGIFFRRPSPQDPGPLLVAIPSQRSINGISSGVLLPKTLVNHQAPLFETLESFSNLGLDHIARAIQRWNYCRVHEPFTCS